MTKNKDYDKKIFRLMSMLNKLNGGSSVRSSEMAKEFNVNIRTIQRDLDLLSQTGFPINMLEKGEYCFMEGFSLKKMKLTDEEASLLSLFHEIANSLGENFSRSFRLLMSKMLSQEDTSPFYVKLPATQQRVRHIPFLEDLAKAIEMSRKVSIVYQAEQGEESFKISPLKLINFEGFWYVLAMPEGKRQFWKFRSEKIRNLELLAEYFEPPRNLKAILDRSVNIWFSEQEGQKIRLEIDKLSAHYFKEKIYFPEQKIIKEKKDGSLIVETKANFREVLRTIIHWIPDIRVIAPKELDDQIRGLLMAYLKGAKPRWG